MSSKQVITPYEPSLRLRVGSGRAKLFDGCSGSSPGRRRTVRPNGTPDWHLLIVLEGQFTVNPEGCRPIPLAPRSAALFPPHVRQDYTLNDHCEVGKTFWAHFFQEATMLELLDWPKASSDVGVLQWEDDEALHRNIIEACGRCESYLVSDYTRKRSLALLSLEEILRLISQANPQAPMDALDDRVALSLQFIANHIKDPLSIEALASEIGLSSSRLSHLFTTNLNCTVMAYIEKQRIQLACGMLTNTQLPITQIAENCGFSSSYYFSKRFRKFKKMSPSEYRLASLSEG